MEGTREGWKEGRREGRKVLLQYAQGFSIILNQVGQQSPNPGCIFLFPWKTVPTEFLLHLHHQLSIRSTRKKHPDSWICPWGCSQEQHKHLPYTMWSTTSKSYPKKLTRVPGKLTHAVSPNNDMLFLSTVQTTWAPSFPFWASYAKSFELHRALQPTWLFAPSNSALATWLMEASILA